MTIRGGPGLVVLPPDCATTLIWGSDATCQPVLLGPRTVAHYHVDQPGPSCFEARIKPGSAWSLLGASVAALVDRAAPMRDYCDVRDLFGLEPSSVLERLAEMSAPNAVRLEHEQLVLAAARLLSADRRGPKRVDTIAQMLNVSERHLRQVFIEAVGVSPKQYVRIERLRAVLRRAGQVPLAQLATDAGYYDQSHLSLEFRRIMGVPPGAFLAGRYPAACS